ncbi:hypothetical protein M5U04_14380 [Xenorhabdus sp. XENO-1]|uniref:hypothetical protein n=1 Tax=Xenorhabdus bovienii TaxID=40576 RepID=UPI0020CA2EF2|nr:hypothetical protein [Xenorhabdus bovienii]MCP9269243.1 hypothetical protein [Xenorhabdus bovienii subsp. africana]
MSQSKFTQAEWLDIFEQQKKSELTIQQFCQKTVSVWWITPSFPPSSMVGVSLNPG